MLVNKYYASSEQRFCMRKILIYNNINETEYAIFKKTDYTTVYRAIRDERNGYWANFANKLWLQALISEISIPENQIEYLVKPMDSRYINEHYDSIILSCANIFSIDYCKTMEKYTEEFANIRIPIFVISCGVQASSYAELQELIKQIGDTSARFIDTIYCTGGEFSLRGYFTKEFFDKLGFPTAVVTGCPSLYQNGRELSINKPQLEKNQLKPLINGKKNVLSTKLYSQIFHEYSNAVFIDQDHYGEYLYDLDTTVLDKLDLKHLMELVKKESYLALELLASDRMRYFIDMPNWREYIINEGYNFSFGVRIHGNIMSLLCGIPAVVYACDSRTREMAEFYDIPIFESGKKSTLYDIYCDSNYDKFNKTFGDKYDAYERFLKEHNLIDEKMNTHNIFFNDSMLADKSAPAVNNREKLSSLQGRLEQFASLLKAEDALLKFARKFKG